jgi:tetratricopeptide (TPR) repeat protein
LFGAVLGALVLVCAAGGLWLHFKTPAPSDSTEIKAGRPQPGLRENHATVNQASPAKSPPETQSDRVVTQAVASVKTDPVHEAVAEVKTQEVVAASEDKVAKQTAESERRYAAAMKEARSALTSGDYASALVGADAALAIKANDEQASKLKTDIQAEQSYQTAFKRAQDAFAQGDYATVLKQVDLAAQSKSADPALEKLKQSAAKQIAKAEQDKQDQQQYLDGLNAGRAALQRRDYAQAIAQADAALRLRPKEPEATRLKLTAQQEQSYDGANVAFKQGDYAAALSQCKTYQGTERFDRLGQQINQEQSQLQALQKALSEGNYGAILGAALPGKPAFDSIKTAAATENQTLQQARQKLAAGDYGFIGTIEQQGYQAKPPFGVILDTGRKEAQSLNSLRSAQQSNDRSAVRTGLAKLAPEVRSKAPFTELDKWATQSTEVSTKPLTVTPPLPANVARLENVLHGLEIRFGLKDPDASVVDHDGNPVSRETNLTNSKRAEATAKVRYLKEYRSDGWLSEERKARLQKVEDAIRNWKD